MENIPFLATQISFIVLTIVMYSFVLTGLKSALAKTSWEEKRKENLFLRTRYVLIGWAVLISVLSISGFFSNFSSFPPRFVIVLMIPLITLIIISFFSRTTAEILKHVPTKYILRLQVFRVFVELLLWILFLQNLIPIQMTFEGRNFDVLAGITGPIAAYFLVNSKTGLFIWNILSMGLLINIVTIALLSLPTPLRVFMNEPSSAAVTSVPFVWLPGLLVPLAYGLHFLSLRQLTLNSNQ
jgi:hypothetical protein